MKKQKTCTVISIRKINKVIKYICIIAMFISNIVMISVVITISYVYKLHVYYKNTFEFNNQIGSSHICI